MVNSFKNILIIAEFIAWYSFKCFKKPIYNTFGKMSALTAAANEMFPLESTFTFSSFVILCNCFDAKIPSLDFIMNWMICTRMYLSTLSQICTYINEWQMSPDLSLSRISDFFPQKSLIHQLALYNVGLIL